MGMTRGTRGERGAKLGRTLKKGLLYTLFELEIRLIHVIKLEYKNKWAEVIWLRNQARIRVKFLGPFCSGLAPAAG